MNNRNCDGMFFNDAIKIHAICADKGLTENDARLFTYMHAKASDSQNGINYFLMPSPEDAEALEVMLGKKKIEFRLPTSSTINQNSKEAIELILTIAERISDIDAVLATECGLENRLSGELHRRLRLYNDFTFRDKMIATYCEHILPEIDQYNKDKIDQALEKRRLEQEKIDKELTFLTRISEF